MAETGRNWTRRSIEELVENYIRRKGGYTPTPSASGGIIVPGCNYDGNYSTLGEVWRPYILVNSFDKRKRLATYNRNTNEVTMRQTLNALCFIDIEPGYIYPSTSQNYKHSIPVVPSNGIWENSFTGGYRPATVNEPKSASPFWDGYVNENSESAINFTYSGPCIELFYNILKDSYLDPDNLSTENNNIRISKDDFVTDNEQFGRPGVYVCLYKYQRVSSNDRQVYLTWCKFDDASVEHYLFDNIGSGVTELNLIHPHSSYGYNATTDSDIVAQLNSMLDAMVAANFPDYSTSGYAAQWRIILPYGNISVGQEFFDFPYKDMSQGSKVYTYHEDFRIVGTGGGQNE